MPDEATPGKQPRKRATKASAPSLNGRKGLYQEILDEHQAAIDSGEIIDTRRQRGEGVIDPRDQFAHAPPYVFGQLPKTFENYVADCVASWGGDPAAYACAFIAYHCAALHSSVKVNTNPAKPNNFRNPNDFSLTLGKSGKAKSGMFKDLTRFYDEWQTSLDKVVQAAPGKRGAARVYPPAMFLQTASTEGMLRQVHDNKGERLVMGCEEAMNFYTGAGAHHGENGVSLMSDAVCAAYDGGSFRKRLVNSIHAIPECLATLIMATTFDKFAKWKLFNEVVDSGMVGRHTVGVIANATPKDNSKAIAGAEEKMKETLAAIRGMRHMRFVLADDAKKMWLQFCQDKDAENDAMERDRVNPGLVNWCRKYDLRIMSLATILQAYAYVDGGMIDGEETVLPSDDKVGGITLRTVRISKANLGAAVAFVEGYLQESQAHFYEIAQGVTEFGPELLNFIAYRVTTDDPDIPEGRWIVRRDLTHNGPASVRAVPDVDARNETARRWIKTLLDYGYIEPFWDHPKAREFKTARGDLDAAHYRVRAEVFEKFESDEDRAWLKAHYDESRGSSRRTGVGAGCR